MSSANIRVVTDSTCDLPGTLVRDYGITVVPASVCLDDQLYLDGVSLTTADLLARPAGSAPPTTEPPSTATFEQVYRRVAADRPCDGILSIHPSASLSGALHSANAARAALGQGVPILVVDSQAASLGLGLLVSAVARQAATGASWNELLHTIQRLRGQTHFAWMADSAEPLARSGRWGKGLPPAESLVGNRPVFWLDEGRITLLDRTRTRHKAFDALASFVEDFPQVASLALVYGNQTPDVEAFIGRLATARPQAGLIAVQYGPANAAHFGPNAVGVAVTEG